ncbi:hypothetical protein GGX14DRAFT_442264 [Mycena pura]|uniref:SHSP domain-containing protein n=1 Tax=Mycena pura TaxID=153505 RepID=A0AAD6YFD4_9AGAR|nr:hypothetical protein GGX14DRAFT_442264 [Mycena pura]
MSPARTRKSQTMSNTDAAARQALMRRLLATYTAIRAGRLRIVNPNPSPHTTFRPRMEIYDDPASPIVIATLELPGVSISDLAIGVKQGKLEIKGRRCPRYPTNRRPPTSSQADADAMHVDSAEGSQAQATEDERRFPVKELRYGSFHRAIPLPAGLADTSCIKASLSDGLLTVSWPRALSQVRPDAGQVSDGSATSAAVATDPDRSSVERPTSSVRGDGEPRLRHNTGRVSQTNSRH